MGLRTFEGTWEEITQLGPELTGRKVRLTILDEPVARPTLEHALAPLIADAERLAASLPPAPSDLDWSEGVLDKD